MPTQGTKSTKARMQVDAAPESSKSAGSLHILLGDERKSDKSKQKLGERRTQMEVVIGPMGEGTQEGAGVLAEGEATQSIAENICPEQQGHTQLACDDPRCDAWQQHELGVLQTTLRVEMYRNPKRLLNIFCGKYGWKRFAIAFDCIAI